MNQLVLAPRLACIVFVRIRDFSRMPVREQALQSDALHALMETALAALPQDQRLLLEVPDGAAIVVPDDPRAALALAEALHARAPELSLCIGLNYGPVKLAGEDGLTVLVGDGLAAAATTAHFATPERLLAARAFRDALRQAAPEHAGRLARAGMFTDSRVRSHELYAVDARLAQARRLRLWASGALVIALILASGVAARLFLRTMPPELPAVVMLDIRPYGDIWVDGLLRGHSPPLAEFELKAGHHLIQVKSGNLAPYDTEVTVRPGERITLAHKFVQPLPRPPAAKPQPPAPPPESGGFFQNLKKKFGF